MINYEWISVEDELPGYGEPVLIRAKGVTQYITYILDGSDHTPDWFEPYYFDHDGNMKIWWNQATHWMPLPEAPE